MNLTLLLSTFATVFLAELGDKTQLATVAISGTSNRPLAVFIGSSSALVLASLIGADGLRVFGHASTMVRLTCEEGFGGRHVSRWLM